MTEFKACEWSIKDGGSFFDEVCNFVSLAGVSYY
jgi:hypothetical protein